MTDQAKIKVSIQLDEEEAKRVLAGINQISEEAGNAGNAATKEAATNQSNLSKTIKDSIEQYEFEDEKLNKLLQTARALGKDEQFYAILHKKGYSEGIVAIQKMLGLKTQDNALTKEQIKLMQLRATELRHESIALRRGAMDLRLFSEASFITGIAGLTAMTLMAKQFADAFEKGNADAAKFTASMNRMVNAKNRIGQEFSKALLPFIQEATNVLDTAGQFLQAHPEIASAAIKGAEILIAIGVIGKTIAFATRLTADFLAIQSSIMRLVIARAEEKLNTDKELAAAEIQKAAADEMLQAAGIQADAAGVEGTSKAVGIAGLGGMSLGQVGLLAAGVAGQVALSVKIAKGMNELQNLLPEKFQVFVDQLSQAMVAVPGLQFIDSIRQIQKAIENDIPSLQRFIQQLFNVGEVAGRTSTTPAGRMNIANAVPGSIENSPKLDEMLDAYEKYLSDLERMSLDHYDKMIEIAADAQEAIRKENEKYADAVAKVNTNLAKTLSKLQSDYARNTEEDERKYLQRKKDIEQDEADELLKIQQDLKDKLAKLERESALRQMDLLAARDALGLVKEQRRLAEQELEAKLEAQKELQRHRSEVARRLAELDREYAETKARRLADYQARVQEEQEQAKERLEELRKEHEDRLKEIKAEAAQKAAEEQRNFQEERRRLYNQFINRLRDLDAFYLGEINLQRTRRTQMMQDLDAFLIAYRAKWATVMNATPSPKPTASGGTVGGSAGSHAFGGYAPYGTYTLGDLPGGGKGPEEFVMSGNTTKAAEGIIGRKLSQAAILNAMMNSKKSGTTIIWQDQRRFDSRLSLADRRAIMEDTKQVIQEMIS